MGYQFTPKQNDFHFVTEQNQSIVLKGGYSDLECLELVEGIYYLAHPFTCIKGLYLIDEPPEYAGIPTHGLQAATVNRVGSTVFHLVVLEPARKSFSIGLICFAKLFIRATILTLLVFFLSFTSIHVTTYLVWGRDVDSHVLIGRWLVGPNYSPFQVQGLESS